MITLWQRLNTGLLVLILLVLVGVLGTFALRAEGGPLDPPATPASTDGVREPGTPITAPTVITSPGRYYLTRDIATSGSQSGIEIAASRVTLDLNGFSIVGNGATGSFGVLVSGSRLDIDIRHGRILAFQIGLHTGPVYRVLIDDVHVADSGRGIQLGQSATLRNCSSSFNDETGIYAPGAEVLIQNCVVRDNGLGA